MTVSMYPPYCMKCGSRATGSRGWMFPASHSKSYAMGMKMMPFLFWKGPVDLKPIFE